MTDVQEELQRHTATCEAAGVASAQLCVEHILSAVLNCPRLLLPEARDRNLRPEERDALTRGVARLVSGEPLQYVLGDVEFYGYRLVVDRRVLIPRPETEELVSAALALPLWAGGGPVDVIDVGTGSGCIAVAVANERRQARILAIDASQPALEVARANVAAHELAGRVTLLQGDLLAGVEAASADLVISNPPYVSEAEYGNLDAWVRDFEPREALAAGSDGLDVVRRLLPQAGRVLRPGGSILLEIGAGQRLAVESLLKNCGFADIVGLADITGLDRIVKATCP